MRLPLSAGRGIPIRFAACLIAIGLGAAGFARAATPAGSPFGRWQVPDGGVIEIARCGDGLCGTIVGLGPGAEQSRSKAGEPLCGLTIIRAPAQTAPGVWGGTVTNPNDETTWHCELWAEADGLHLRGYVLLPLLGQTQRWTSYAGRIGPGCRKLG